MANENIIQLFNELGGSTTPISTLKSELEQCGLNYAGRGANRIVFADSQENIVYKFPISSTGTTQNKTAYDLFQDTKSEPELLVAPIIEYRDGVLKQQYCHMSSNPNHQDILQSKLDVCGYEYLDWDDSSVGIYNSEPVLVDIVGLQEV